MAVPTFNWTILNGNATWTITGTAESDKVIATATDAGKYLYPRLPAEYQIFDVGGNLVPFDSLTLVQKKAVIGVAAQRYFVDCASAWRATDAADTARDTAIEEAKAVYGL